LTAGGGRGSERFEQYGGYRCHRKRSEDSQL